jgi:hypothetical protein
VSPAAQLSCQGILHVGGGNAHRFFLAGGRQAGSVLELEGQFGERERVLAKIGRLHVAGQVA